MESSEIQPSSICADTDCPFVGKSVKNMLESMLSTRKFSDRCARSERPAMSALMEKFYAIECMKSQTKPSNSENLNPSSSSL